MVDDGNRLTVPGLLVENIALFTDANDADC
jgi:hypothetical protein